MSGYVEAGYTVILSTLAIYGVRLVWRYGRLARQLSQISEGEGRNGTPGTGSP